MTTMRFIVHYQKLSLSTIPLRHRLNIAGVSALITACGTASRINCNCIAPPPIRLINSVTNGRRGVPDLTGDRTCPAAIPDGIEWEIPRLSRATMETRGSELNRQKSRPSRHSPPSPSPPPSRARLIPIDPRSRAAASRSSSEPLRPFSRCRNDLFRLESSLA